MPDRDRPELGIEQKPDSQLDLLLRSALATYAEPGSDSDLVNRILVGVAAEGAPAPARRWLPWAIALPVAAGLLALAFLLGSGQMHMPAGDQNQAHISPSLPNATTLAHLSATLNSSEAKGTKSQIARPRPVLAAAKPAPMPKLDVFPTPQPLTPEERALADVATQTPKPELQALVEAQSQAGAPLSIAPIQIQPLNPPDHGGN